MQPSNDRRVDALTRRYDIDAPAYLSHWAPVLREPAWKLVERAATSRARRVLDVGAGAGALFPALAQRFPDAHIIGVDRSAGMLSQARDGTPVAVMDALDLGFPDGVFDVAVMCFVLFHFPDAVTGLREARRVLRAGGELCVSTWGADVRSPAVDLWNELLEASGAAPADRLALHDLMDSQEKVEALFNTAGFESVRTESSDFTFETNPDDFLTLRTSVGSSAQRVESLSAETREELIDEARTRLAAMSPVDFVLHYRVILAFGHAPA